MDFAIDFYFPIFIAPLFFKKENKSKDCDQCCIRNIVSVVVQAPISNVLVLVSFLKTKTHFFFSVVSFCMFLRRNQIRQEECQTNGAIVGNLFC